MKRFAYLLVVVMLLACLPLTAFAAKVGDEVTITFKAQNDGFAAYAATVNYDDTVLELVGIAVSGLGDVNGNSVMVMGLTPITNKNLFTATFKILPAAKAGETYNVTATVTEAYDENVNPVSLSISGGSVKIDDCDHSWGAWAETKPATCDEDGEQTRTCSKCGETETKPIPATGHKWDDGVVTTPATCGDPGVKTFTCQNDSSHTKTEVIDPTGNHTGSYVKIDGNDKQHKVTCTVCGKDGDLEDHSWDKGTVTTPATCGDPGVKTFTCTKCGYEKTEEIAATGKHTTTVKEIDGNDKQHKVECSVCDYEALEDHKYDKGKVTTPATCLPGQKTYTCSECGHEKFEVIAGDPDKHDRNSVNSWDKVDDKYHQGTCECGETIKEEHTWGEWKVTVPHDEANKKDGEKRRECEYCDAYQTKVIPWDIDIEPDTGDITSQVVMTGAVVLVVMMGAVALVFKRKTAK